MGYPTLNPLRDALSGVIMAATSIPQLLAYAETAGYAGYRGLSTAGLPLLAWGLATGHPYMNSGVTSITAMMAKADLRGDEFFRQPSTSSSSSSSSVLLGNNTNETIGASTTADLDDAYVYLMASYSLWVGLASLILAATGFGQLVIHTVPAPVRAGFKWGCAIGVLISALPNGLFGGGGSELKILLRPDSDHSQWSMILQSVRSSSYLGGGTNILQCLFALTHPWLWTMSTAIIFLFGVFFLLKGSSTLLPPALPPGTEVLILCAVATFYCQQYSYSGSIVGEIPVMDPSAGIFLTPRLRLPVEFLDLTKVLQTESLVSRFGGSIVSLISSASIYAAVNFLSIIGIASGFETEQGIAWSPRRELTAQGVSCLVAAMVGSAPVSGSLSRSLVSRMTGTTSQLACMITALCWIYLQPYMSLMTYCPKAALSAVIVSAVVSGVVYPKDLRKLSGGVPRVVGWSTGAITALTSPTYGFGMGMSLYYLATFLNAMRRRWDRTKSHMKKE